ncbi:MAG TPA: glycine zipper 2TM domain-containing protein [Rhodocyclaceae bacterium]|nr:glycine zipper 2TM domain-containing protein [Rhodocyclaceae bacterium]
MTTNPTIQTRHGLHPMLWVAASAVTIFALAGTAYVTGLLPHHDTPAPATTPAPVAATPAPTEPAAQPPAAAQTATQTPIQAPPQKSVAEAAPAKPAASVVSSKPHRNTERATAGVSPSANNGQVYSSRPAAPPAICRECGIVESNRQIVKEGDGSGLGAVAGGVVGGVLGNGVGQGTGRDLATIAGVVGGAVLGNKIEKNQRKNVSYQTTIRFEDGTSQVFNSEQPTPWQPGDHVRVVDGRISPR